LKNSIATWKTRNSPGHWLRASTKCLGDVE
jgi:hypothetical protein